MNNLYINIIYMATANFDFEKKKNEIMQNISKIELKIQNNNKTLEDFSRDLDKILTNLKNILSGVKQLKSEIDSVKSALSGNLDQANIAKYAEKIAQYQSLLNEIAEKIKILSNTTDNSEQKTKIKNTIDDIKYEIKNITDELGIDNDDLPTSPQQAVKTLEKPPQLPAIPTGGKKRKSYKKIKKNRIYKTLKKNKSKKSRKRKNYKKNKSRK